MGSKFYEGPNFMGVQILWGYKFYGGSKFYGGPNFMGFKFYGGPNFLEVQIL